MDQLGELIDVLVTVIGPVLIVYAVGSFIHTRYFVRHSAETSGEVIRLERSYSAGTISTCEYAPVFCFTAADGKSYTVTSDVFSSPAGFAGGDQVRVRYDPANPSDAKIHTFFQTWGSAVIFGAVGLSFLGFDLYHFGFLPRIH